MNTEQRLNHVADRYREQGYQVIIRPGPDALPSFAKDFHVEILATRADGNVLASAKGNSSEFEADPNLPKYAEVIEKKPGWRYDVFVLGPVPQATPKKSDAKEASEEELSRFLDDAVRILQAGFVEQSVIAAWAALESAMRHRLRSLGSEAGWGTSPRTMLNELVSLGVLSNSDFRDLEGLFQLRNVIAHGFSPPTVGSGVVPFLVATARRLLAESNSAKQTA